MDIEKPAIVHKYITLFSTEDAYNEAYSSFSEANWSDVGYPEDTPDNYRLSRRLSNMYHKDNPPDYKFNDINDFVTEQKEELEKDDDGNWQIVYRDIDIYPDAHRSSNYRLLDYSDNYIRKTFFLEVVWGYFGWEWVDYRRTLEDETEEVLVGGNLYKVKETYTVPHIIDGYRLYHINDFLNSQSKVTTIEDFNTENIKSANRAFKRLERKYGLNTIIPLLLKVYQFPEVVEADDIFCNNKISVLDNHTIEFPKLVNVNGFYKWGEFVDGTTFRMDNLESFTNGFYWANFSQTDFNLGNILVGNSLRKVSDLHGLLEMALFYNAADVSGYDKPINTFTIDLSGSSLPVTTEFNLSRLFYNLGSNYFIGTNELSLQDKYFVFNLTLKGLTDLSSAFRRIMNSTIQGDVGSVIPGVYYKHTAANQIEVNFNNTEDLIRNFDYAFAENTFIEQPPVEEWINDYTTENYIYYSCSFREGVTYNFSPNLILNPSERQFNNCTIRTKKVTDGAEVALPVFFNNVDALKEVIFQNINFTETVIVDGQTVTRNTGIPFPFVGDFHNSRYQYNEDASDLYRYINFSGSKFTSIRTLANPQTTAQTIYVSGQSAATMFDGCTNIDFTGSNIIIDMSPTYGEEQQWLNTAWTIFRNCSSMVRTPKLVNHYIVAHTNGGDILSNMFLNCTSLEYVDAEDFYCIRNLSGIQPINFSNCPNLVYLNMGNVCRGLNLRGCYNLDIDTLNTTLLRQNKIDNNKNAGDFTIQKVIWDRLPTTTQNHITSMGGNINIVEV